MIFIFSQQQQEQQQQEQQQQSTSGAQTKYDYTCYCGNSFIITFLAAEEGTTKIIIHQEVVVVISEYLDFYLPASREIV